MPKFVIVGPMTRGNVFFHVHALGCRDIADSLRDSDGSWETEYPSAEILLQKQLEDLNSQGQGYTSEHFKLFPCAFKARAGGAS